MAWIKKIFAAVFSTEFLKKILLLSAIFVLVDYLDTGVDIRIRHTISNSYGGFDINIRDNK
jgi:hypothetical protein